MPIKGRDEYLPTADPVKSVTQDLDSRGLGVRNNGLPEIIQALAARKAGHSVSADLNVAQNIAEKEAGGGESMSLAEALVKAFSLPDPEASGASLSSTSVQALKGDTAGKTTSR